MRPQPKAPTSLRLAEVMASLSLATDLAMGQPLDHALRSCILAVRLGEALGLGDDELRNIYYQALLRFIGCNAETYAMAAIFGDEVAFRTDIAAIDTSQSAEVLRLVVRHIRQANAGASLLGLTQAVARGLLSASSVTQEGFAGHCEVAQRLAERLGFDMPVVHALGQLYERWDGKGLPGGLRGEAIAPAVRVVALAQDAIIFHRLGGVESAVATARERSGQAYDPHMVERFCQQADALFAGVDEDPTWETVLSLEPGDRIFLSEAQLDTACQAIADFADIKSQYTLGHSSGVADLAASAARHYGLPFNDVATIRRAGLIHDVGRVSVSAGVWGKPGPLTDREWERVRMHPYYTERVFARSGMLAQLGVLASHHHERLDGSGYHRGAAGTALTPGARILAAADAYHAMVEPRPHRRELLSQEAARILQGEARAGRLDTDAVRCVVAAAGNRASSARLTLVAGLTEREIEVLRLAARGQSIKQIAGALTISSKTVDRHLQNIYPKISVSTRAGATLFAMEHGLMSADN